MCFFIPDFLTASMKNPDLDFLFGGKTNLKKHNRANSPHLVMFEKSVGQRASESILVQQIVEVDVGWSTISACKLPQEFQCFAAGACLRSRKLRHRHIICGVKNGCTISHLLSVNVLRN